MNWMNIGLAIGGFATGLGMVLAIFAKPVGHMFHRIIEAAIAKAIAALKADLEKRFDDNDKATKENTLAVVEMGKTVTAIKATVYPNGGASIADKVQRVDVNMARLSGAFEQHVKEHH